MRGENNLSKRQDVLKQVNEELDKYEALRFNDCYAHHFIDDSIIDNTVLLEVRDGKSFTGNVRALYREMIKDNDLDMTYYIVYSNEESLKAIKIFNTFNDKTYFIERNSEDYAKCLATCQYIITNQTMISAFTKKEGQIYINTWHGTALKHLGFDLPQITANKNVLRNFLMTDYIISPNKHMTNVFLKSYKLDGLYEGTILEGGYPRIDETLNTTDIVSQLECQNITLDGRPIILYTPTFRGNNPQNPTFLPEQLLSETMKLVQELPEYQILVKVHPFIFDQAQQIVALAPYLVNDGIDPNALLGITDLLITDYSSIFFDYLVTDKPVIFYCDDQEEYRQSRGLYFDMDELPGPVASTIQQTIDYIRHFDISKYQSQYQTMKNEMTAYDDGKVTQRYIQHIFKQNKCIKEVKADRSKKTLVLYAGGMQNNGITQALLNLLNALDPNDYDISVLLNDRFQRAERQNIEKIPNSVRKIFRVGWPLFTKEERIADRFILAYPSESLLKKYDYHKPYTRESNRVLSGCHFDVAIDYSAYSSYWTKYIAFSKAQLKMAYLHNDIIGEIKLRKEIHGRNLRSMILFYRQYNRLINVSADLKQVNEKKLIAVASPKQMVVAHNLLDLNRFNQTTEFTSIDESFKMQAMIKECVYEGDIELFSDPINLRAKTIHVDKQNQLTIIQKMVTHQGIYYKLLIDYCYVGWIHQELPVRPIEAMVQKIDTYGFIKNTNRQLATLNIPHTSENDIRATGMGRIKNTMAHLTEYVSLPNGLSYFKFRVGHLEAYAEESVFEIDESATQETMDEHNQSLLCEIQSVPQFSGEVCQYYQLIDKEATIYTGLKGLPGIKKKPWPTSRIVDQMLFASWKMTNDHGTYVKFKTPNNYSGWVNINHLQKVDGVPNVSHVINEPCLVEGIDIPLYSSIEQFELESAEQFLPKFEGMMTAEEYMWTKKGPIVRVKYNGATMYINESFIKRLVPTDTWETVNRRQAPKPSQFDYSFITMARLSPEKNQKALIRAVKKVSEVIAPKKVGLYILGEGPLKDELLAEIHNQKLEKNVFLLGQKSNPFQYMKECQYFVFPSIYEGQGLAAMEAITLGMPVIATNNEVLQEVLNHGEYGTFIDGIDSQSIAEAMIRDIKNPPKLKKFDAASYNQKAIQSFEKLINQKPKSNDFHSSWINHLKTYYWYRKEQ